MKRIGPPIFERRFVPRNTIVLKEGEPGANAYLIQSGAVEVFTEGQGGPLKLAALEAGQIFGEMALILDAPRAASVRTTEDSNLIVITRQAFQTKLDKTDPTIKALVHMFTKRILAGNTTRLHEANDISELIASSRVLFENAANSVPHEYRKIYKQSIGPKYDDFIEAVREFQNRYGEAE